MKTKNSNCNDKNCPIHGNLKLRRKSFIFTVTSAKMHRTATLVMKRRHYLPKYQRYEKRTTRLKAHNPDCIAAKKGDVVRAFECRPLSKTKYFAIVEVISK